MKFRLGIGSKSKKVLTTSIEEEQHNFSPKIKAGGLCASKEEIFFDSQAWLDSDCEDDFFSVNGDFTPSRGSTPSRQLNNNRTPHWDKYFSAVKLANAEHSPTDGKRRLFDLLQENESEEPVNKEYVVNVKVDKREDLKVSAVDAEKTPKFPNGTPDFRGTDSAFYNDGTPTKDLKDTPTRYLKHYKERMSKSKQCCLPNLMHSLSFKEKRKHKMSPVH